MEVTEATRGHHLEREVKELVSAKLAASSFIFA